MRRALLAAGYAVFVVGGLAAGWLGLGSLAASSRPGQAPPTPRVEPRPALRDFDQAAPPFSPAGEARPAESPLGTSPEGKLSILLLGIDQRPDEAASGRDPGRTDTMLLVSVDYSGRTVSMVSIPRDGFVVIPGRGGNRVNAAYTYGELDTRGGGPALAKQTVAQLFGVPVDRYALVDIRSLERIIDLLGGIWIDNPRRLVDTAYPTDDYGYQRIDIPAGLQLMNGTVAVQYARTRYPDSDFGREARQQQVLLALRDRALQLDVIPRLPALMPELLRLVRTDLTPAEVAQLASFGRDLDRTRDIVSLQPDESLTPSYTGSRGASYVQLTPAYLAEARLVLTQPRLAAERARIAILNAGATPGSGSAVADLLRSRGLVVETIAAGGATAVTTRIEAGPSARLSAQTVARLLGLPESALRVDDVDGSAVRLVLGADFQLPVASARRTG